jgi:spore germination protein GerM
MTAPRDPDEQYADRLRDALRAEAEQVQPAGDGLARIRERTQPRSTAMRWFRPLTAVATVAIVAAAVVGGVALVRDDDNNTLEAPPLSSSSPSGTPSTTPSPNGTQAPATAITVPVYYLADTERGPRLYREFRKWTAEGSDHSEIATAVEAVIGAEAKDDDYTSLWPSDTRVLGTTRVGDLATIDLSADAGGTFNGGAEFAELSVQQLVYTVTAADTAAKRVQILIEGQEMPDLWGQVDVSDPQQRSPQIDVLGPVWVLAPTEGQSTATPVQLSGTASVFEANVSIEIMRNGQVVKRTFATASTGAPERGSWKKKVILTPGTYEVRAFESSAENGEPMYIDDKTFTVS